VSVLAELLIGLVYLGLNTLAKVAVDIVAVFVSESFNHLVVWVGQLDSKSHGT
jgi:hypothetical protein